MAHEQSDFLFLQQYAQPPDSSFCSRYTVTGLDFSSNAAQLSSAQSSWNQSTFEYGDIGDDDVEERSSLHDPNSFLQQDSITHDHQYFSLGGDGDIQLFDVDPSSIFNPSTHHHDYRPNHIEDGLVVDTDHSTKSMINHVFPTPLFDSSISSAFSTPSTFSNHEPSYDSNDMIVDLNVLETTSFSPKANSISSSSILATKVYNTEPCNKELDMKMIMKRPRLMEMPSPMPTFKVRKEKLGDRVTALQQLVSPFGKNDTASVLHEATKYIKFLHNQVLSATNISDGNPIQQHQMNTKRWDRDKKISGLRSRGLCLVPISTTFQIVNESSSPNYLTTMFEGTF